jgi:hypothetical protein
MGPLDGTVHTGDREPNQVLAVGIDYEDLAVEIQQYLCTGIPILPSHCHKVITS